VKVAASTPISICIGRVHDALKFFTGEIVGGNALFFGLLHLDGRILVEPIVTDAELEKAD
jgi:hypothetical protein